MLAKFAKKSLRIYIVVTNIFTILLPVCLTGFIINNIINGYLENEITKKNHIIASTISNQLNQLLIAPSNILKHVIAEAEHDENYDFNAQISLLLKQYDLFDNVELISIDGKVISTYPRDRSLIGKDVSKEEYFKEVKAMKTYWSLPYISKKTGQLTVNTAVSGYKYLITAYLNLKNFSNTSYNIIEAYGKDIDVVVLDENGTYVSNSSLKQLFKREIDPNFQKIKTLVSSKNPIDIVYSNNEKKIVSTSLIPVTGWYVLVYQSYDSAFEAKSKANMIFIISAIVSIVLFFIVSLLRANSMSRLFEKFDIQTQAIASGNSSEKIKIDSFSEFSNLEEKFNLMIEKLQSREEKLKWIAYNDTLTGLKNRSFLLNHLEVLLDKNNGNKSVGIIYFDLDNFKTINDTYGHSYGDMLLSEVSKRLIAINNDSYIIARIGGDEFVVINSCMVDIWEMADFSNRILKALEEPFVFEDNQLFIGASIGISAYPKDAQTVEELLKCADMAMYFAKENGKNKWQIFDSKMKEIVERNLNVERYLRKAIDRNEFSLSYQPQFHTITNKMRGFEVLLRWDNDELGGNVEPVEFIRVAENSGFINEIGEWVIRSACKKLEYLWNNYFDDFIISVNISPIQLMQHNFIDLIESIISQYSILPEMLEFEITESVFIESYDQARINLEKIKKMGIKISLDDFGTGYSSLSYLNNLPIDSLKIDRTFVSDVSKGIFKETMLESIIILAHKLGLDVIAEGVETRDQLFSVRKFNCDFAQGFHFSEPISESDLDDYLKHKGYKSFRNSNSNYKDYGAYHY
ncbi:bifunctional diguanylate cyclase/phosphodiesterase [Pseudobacteroides cellulosolvens]|uniref:Diguanylate cyclase/phosphodiesterase n=1 Tax=Pseudobacteroides cellulosolvens ATCC 35603 = DSM 2933 TaxID=398512 RepID=A0A0L6JIQ6_9FIRM|nr:EAL domain-containing protein [Pseudobacteroides cellulosolvens]KNY25620.1 diguanylate cyclase/phosphodiesterase [Pseudobacteroides cellulosolvens ATCC 35603 = DSM 2933]